MRSYFAILKALGTAVRRDLAAFESVKVNNFFLFVALLIYGALVSGVKPASAYPFLLVLGFLLLFPLSSDPLARIPPDRLASWPLGRGSRFALRLASFVFSPVLWLTVFLMARTSWRLALFFLALATGIQAAIAMFHRAGARAPRWTPWRAIPQPPGRLGGLILNNTREMLSVLDTYLALLLSLGGIGYRFFTPHPDPEGYPILSLLVTLALSTYAQCLFGLDSASGSTRYGLLPLPAWQILLAKDIAWLGVLAVLVLPLDFGPGLTFGLTALAIGHFAPMRHQQRWRFTSGTLAVGAAQVLLGLPLGLAESRQGFVFLVLTAVGWSASLVWSGRASTRRRTQL